MTWLAVIGGGHARRWLSNPRSLAVLDRVTGLVLMGFGGALLADTLAGPGPAATGGRSPAGAAAR